MKVVVRVVIGGTSSTAQVALVKVHFYLVDHVLCQQVMLDWLSFFLSFLCVHFCFTPRGYSLTHRFVLCFIFAVFAYHNIETHLSKFSGSVVTCSKTEKVDEVYEAI